MPTNRISSVTQGTTLTYSYDRAGNVTSDGVHTYQYDAENRVVSVDNGITAQYSYNHRNQRVKKVAGGATTHYVCHNEGVLAEYNGTTGALLVQYVSLGHQQFAKIDNGTTYYYLSDRLSARVVLDGTGNVVGRQTTLPYGEALATDGTTDKRLFTTYERDSEAGNDDAWHRKYAYGVGRFLSADPYKASAGRENPQSWNRYSYVLNNPVNFIDPAGLLVANPNPQPPETPSCVSGPGSGGGGGGTNQDPLSCTVSVYDRLIEAVHGIPVPGARHGYIIFSINGAAQTIYEGQHERDTHLLIAVGGGVGTPLLDRPIIDHFDGEITGTEVCGWLVNLNRAVATVNAANIRYHGLGPNSSSVLRYLLKSLPKQGWYHMPFMVGYGSKLPGIET